MFLENIKLALLNFVTHKTRAVLSLLGIVIGVSSVILITTLSKSATANIEADIKALGMDLVSIYGGWGSPRSKKAFAANLGKQLEEELPGITASTPLLTDSIGVKGPFDILPYPLHCVDSSFGEVFSLSATVGRLFTKDEAARRQPVTVLGYEAAKKLFPAGGALGSTVKFLFEKNVHQMVVIGILEKKDPIMGMSFNDGIFMGLNYYTGKIAKVKVFESFYLKTRKNDMANQAKIEVEDYLVQSLALEPEDFWVDSPSSMQKAFTQVTRTISLVLGGIAAISLLVGGIGIMNIMLVSVTERTREIGIRKALGARKKVIRRQFLTESVVLTLAGGILGSLAGFGLGRLGTMLMKLTFVPDYFSFGLSLGFSAIIGVFFGFYPAVRASKLDPIKALSYE